MPPKKKAQKMALADFFAETTGGGSSWADEMETALPTAPAAREDTGPRRGEPGYLDSMPDRSARTAMFPGAPGGRAEVPLPDVPPFTAFVGNLTFEVQDDEVRDFFGSLSPISVRLVKDSEGKAKGFGYVEFGSRDDLKNALDLSGQNLGGRTVRINVAEAPSRPGGRDYAPSAADEASQWRRTAPLAPREPPAPRRTFSGASGGDDRDWGAARGAKFTPSRESSGYGRPRGGEMHEPTAADEASQWRSSKPLVAAEQGPRRGPGAHGPGAHGPHGAGRDTPPRGPADTESTWSRGTRVATPPAAPAEPQRQRLNLLPRTGDKAAATTPDSATSSSGASPFGAARPVDTLSREREAEEHLAARRAAAAKQREDAEKAKAAAKERREREHAEARERKPVRVHPSRLPPKEVAQADEDGFEAVTSKGATRQQQENKDAPKAEPKRKDAGKGGFSFAAAAGELDVDELAEETEKIEV